MQRTNDYLITMQGIKVYDEALGKWVICDGGKKGSSPTAKIGSGNYFRIKKVYAKEFHIAISKMVQERREYLQKKGKTDDTWRVDVHNEAEYQNTKNFVIGHSTFSVKEDGDIISVGKHPIDDTVSGKRLLKNAIDKGGNKLDSYDGNNIFYQKCGFEPIAACKGYAEHEKGNVGRIEDIIFYRYNPNYKPDKKEMKTVFNADASLTINRLKNKGAYFEGTNGYEQAQAYRDDMGGK